MSKRFKFTALIIICILVGLILFIEFDTSAAAVFTDNYLRPLFGNNVVGLLEKGYFNTTDQIQKITTETGLTKNYNLTVDDGTWKDKFFFKVKTLKPDPDRPFAIVHLAQIDMSKYYLGAVAGIKQPGGPVGNAGPGKVPQDIIDSQKLVAAFDGGFQYRDGGYGMIVGDTTYLPLKNDVGTIIGYKDGSIKIINYHGQDLGNNISFIRQNCPILIEYGKVFAQDEKNKKLWGRTFNSDIYTWRSGIGIDESGNLIYAVGNNLSPETLAVALRQGGAVNAIQLDINPFWVRFNIFEPLANGGYKSDVLIKDLKDGSKDYLKGYSKDFFYIYKK